MHANIHSNFIKNQTYFNSNILLNITLICIEYGYLHIIFIQLYSCYLIVDFVKSES